MIPSIMSRVNLISSKIVMMPFMFFLIFMIVSIMLGLKFLFLMLSDMLGFVINLVSIMPRILLFLLCFNMDMIVIIMVMIYDDYECYYFDDDYFIYDYYYYS